VHDHNVYIPPWYFIDETNLLTKAHGLRSYYHDSWARQNLLLNFCGSIIRQLSLGCILGYEEINVFGIEPSLPSYWYTSKLGEVSKSLRGSYLPFALSIFEAMAKLERNHHDSTVIANCFSDNIEWLGFTRSILLCARYFAKFYSRTLIRFHTDDPMVASMAEELYSRELIVSSHQS
jgi:hypothetical protein